MLNTTLTREEQLQELISFADTVKIEIANITSTLGWTVESVTANEEETHECPYDSAHQMPEKSLSKHLERCQWKAEGYEPLDMPFSVPTLAANDPSSIYFDEHLQDNVLQNAKGRDSSLMIGTEQRLIPRTSDRLIRDFTRDERRVLYEYVIANTAKPDIGYDITDIGQIGSQNKTEKEISFLEALVQERNLKRRRAKHKGVHTNKKSHTEILREVINQQMDIYTDYLRAQQDNELFKNNIQSPNTNTDMDGLRDSYEVPDQSSIKYHTFFSKEKDERYLDTSRNQQKEILKDHIDKRYYQSKQYSKHDYQQELLQEDIEVVSPESKHQKRYTAHSPSERYKSRKRKHRYHHSRSRSKERKSHKKSKHQSKEGKHKKRKHKSRERDEDESKTNISRHKHKSKTKDR